MNVIFHPEAVFEFDCAIDYYEEQQAGLGAIFAEEVAATINRIKNYPLAWSVFSHRTRRCLLHRFPYGIIYYLTEGAIYIIAVFHLHRRPGYWKDRRQQNMSK